VVGTITPDVAALLDRFSLTPAELPSGYAALGKVLLPNDQATLGTADPQATLKQIQQTGRQGGVAQQVIGPGLDSGQIGVSVEVFKDPSGAQQWVARPPDFDQTYRTSAAALPDPLGEQSNAVHWTQGNMGGYVVNFRRGRLVFGLGLSAAAGKESLDPLLSIARRLDEKAKQQTN